MILGARACTSPTNLAYRPGLCRERMRPVQICVQGALLCDSVCSVWVKLFPEARVTKKGQCRHHRHIVISLPPPPSRAAGLPLLTVRCRHSMPCRRLRFCRRSAAAILTRAAVTIITNGLPLPFRAAPTSSLSTVCRCHFLLCRLLCFCYTIYRCALSLLISTICSRRFVPRRHIFYCLRSHAAILWSATVSSIGVPWSANATVPRPRVLLLPVCRCCCAARPDIIVSGLQLLLCRATEYYCYRSSAAVVPLRRILLLSFCRRHCAAPPNNIVTAFPLRCLLQSVYRRAARTFFILVLRLFPPLSWPGHLCNLATLIGLKNWTSTFGLHGEFIEVRWLVVDER